MNSLESAYRIALNKDNLFRAAEAQHRASLERLPQARAGLLPVINANVNRTRYDAQVEYADPRFQEIDRQFRVNGWTVTLTQPLFRMANFIQYGRAEIEVEQAHATLGLARQDLMLRTAKAFIDWQAALRKRQAAEAGRLHLKEAANLARSAHAEKLITTPNLLEAEARAAKAEADAQDALAELKSKAAALSKITGIPPGEILFSCSLNAWPELSGAVEQWLERALEGNGQVRVRSLQLAMAEKDLDAARAGHLPTLNLVANKSRTFNSGSTDIVSGSTANLQHQISLGLQLEVPIFAGGMVVSRTSEAAALRDKAREEMENVRGAVDVDVRTFFAKAQSGIARIRAAELRVNAAASALAEARSGKALAVRLGVDVRAAEAAWYSAQSELFLAQTDAMMSLLQLRQAAGELDENDLAQWSNIFSRSVERLMPPAMGPIGMK